MTERIHTPFAATRKSLRGVFEVLGLAEDAMGGFPCGIPGGVWGDRVLQRPGMVLVLDNSSARFIPQKRVCEAVNAAKERRRYIRTPEQILNNEGADDFVVLNLPDGTVYTTNIAIWNIMRNIACAPKDDQNKDSIIETLAFRFYKGILSQWVRYMGPFELRANAELS